MENDSTKDITNPTENSETTILNSLDTLDPEIKKVVDPYLKVIQEQENFIEIGDIVQTTDNNYPAIIIYYTENNITERRLKNVKILKRNGFFLAKINDAKEYYRQLVQEAKKREEKQPTSKKLETTDKDLQRAFDALERSIKKLEFLNK